MSGPVYLGIRARRTLRHAADLLNREAQALFDSHQIDGVLIEEAVRTDYADMRCTADDLERIARERVNKETKR